MNRLMICCLALVTLFASLSFAAHAEDDDAGLHILRSLIHADRDQAEVCLEADHLLDAGSHTRIVATLKLENEGKTQRLAPQNVILDDNNLCLLGLDHRRDYNLTLPFLLGAKGEKLSETYTTSFSVPDRHATLDFIGNAAANGLIVWHNDDPMLQVVNIDHVHVELYRITDVAALGNAWRQRLQTTLAPSESVYFAKHNGTLIGQQDIDLKTTPNARIEQPIVLGKLQPEASPGLYLLVASAPQAAEKAKKLTLAPLAATWLLRSNLDLHAVPSSNGFYALTEQNHRSEIAAGVRIILQDSSQKLLSETKTDANGMAFLPYAEKDHKDAATLIGLTPQGDVAFADINPLVQSPYVLPESEASLIIDKDFYQPQETINVTLSAHDMKGQSLPLKEGSLHVLRPDHSLFTVLPVPSTEKGMAHIAFSAPLGNGLWSLAWVGGEGTVLAQTPLRLTTSLDAPHFNILTDRSMVSDDEAIDLTIKSVTYNDSAAPYLTGQIAVTWVVPDKIFPEFADYGFGVPDHGSGQAMPLASFVTDGKGIAHLHVKLNVPAQNSPVQAAVLTATGDISTGVLGSNTLIIPVRPKDFVVGVKAETQDNRFPENSLAHFSLIALDANGKRRAVDDLSYQIFEEGRHFDWYPTEGRWDYKPLRQERRLGGAPLTLSAQDANIIEWPVSAGVYRLDIMDADGNTVTRLPFSAGWGFVSNDHVDTDALTLVPSKDSLHIGQTTSLQFVLPQPAVVTAIIADDQVRQVIHGLRSQGDNTIDIVPQQDWGKRLFVSVFASGTDLSGHILLPSSSHDTEALMSRKENADSVDPLVITANIPNLLKHNDTAKTSIILTNTTLSDEAYRYNLSASAGLLLTGAGQGSITLAAGQKKIIPLVLKPSQQGAQSMHLDIIGPRNMRIARNWSISIADSLPWLVSGQELTVNAQQTQVLDVLDKKRKSPHDFVMIGRSLPLNMPEVLSSFLHVDALTTSDMARWLEMFNRWRQIIIQVGFLSEDAFALRQQDVTQQLLGRQEPDGGFSVLPHQDSDLASTTTAIYALINLDTPAAKLSLDQASGWLRRYLENGWFDESERPLRAAAYAALAVADRLDVSSLYYFSDNSKSLPSLAAAQLAQAFLAINDRPKAQYWLKNIEPASTQGKDLSLLAALITDPLTDTTYYPDALNKAAPELIDSKTPSLAMLASFLQIVAILNDRSGSWHAVINGSDRIFQGLQITAAIDKPFTIHNITDASLIVLPVSEKNMKPMQESITRHLYRPNGIDVTNRPSFEQDGVYVMVLDGAWPKDSKDPVVINDEPSAALYPISCALNDAIQTNETLAWLNQQPLNPGILCEPTAQGLRVVLDPATRNGEDWHIAYLVKAKWSGNFGLSQARVSP